MTYRVYPVRGDGDSVVRVALVDLETFTLIELFEAEGAPHPVEEAGEPLHGASVDDLLDRYLINSTSHYVDLNTEYIAADLNQALEQADKLLAIDGQWVASNDLTERDLRLVIEVSQVLGVVRQQLAGTGGVPLSEVLTRLEHSHRSLDRAQLWLQELVLRPLKPRTEPHGENGDHGSTPGPDSTGPNPSTGGLGDLDVSEDIRSALAGAGLISREAVESASDGTLLAIPGIGKAKVLRIRRAMGVVLPEAATTIPRSSGGVREQSTTVSDAPPETNRANRETEVRESTAEALPEPTKSASNSEPVQVKKSRTAADRAVRPPERSVHGELVEWDESRNFGYAITSAGERVFVHGRQFRGVGGTPDLRTRWVFELRDEGKAHRAARGLERETVSVPDVVGRTLEEARTVLAEAGLATGVRQKPGKEKRIFVESNWHVKRQAPEPGVEFPSGYTVWLDVGK